MRSMFFYNNSIKDPRPWLSENGKIIFTPDILPCFIYIYI